MTIKSFALQCGVSDRTIQRRIEKFNKINLADCPSGINDKIDNLHLQDFLKEEFDQPDQFASVDSGSSPLSSQPIRTVEEHEKENEEIPERLRRPFNAEDYPSLKRFIEEPAAEKVILSGDHIEKLKSISKGLSDKQERQFLIDQSNEASERVSKLPNENKPDQMTNLQKRLSSDWLIVFVLLIILSVDMMIFSIIGDHEFKNKIPFANLIFAVIGLATGIGSVVTYNRIKEFKLAEIWKWIFGTLQFCVFSSAVNEAWFLAETVMTIMFVLVFIGVQRSIKK